MKQIKKQYIWWVFPIIILFIFIFSFIQFLYPYMHVKKVAVQVAKEYTSLNKVDDFYLYHGEETYFSVFGKDKDGKEIVVLIPEKGSKISVLDQNEMIHKDQAIKHVLEEAEDQQRLYKESFGIYQDTPVWEVIARDQETGSLYYYYVNYKTGELLHQISEI